MTAERRERRSRRGARTPARTLARTLAITVGAAGGLAAALAAARRLGRDVPPLYRSLRAAPGDWSWAGHRIAWYRSGPHPAGAEPAPVVLVHAVHAAASAWEMRELFDRLGADHRVLAYDLLGFGASDRPDVDYDARLYQDLLRDFLREVAAEPAHVVASSLSGAHALAVAADEPELFRSLTLINPTGLLTQAERPSPWGRALQNLLRTPWLGEALYNLLVSKPSLRWFSSRLYRDSEELPECSTEERYAAAHQPGARYAPAAFLGNALAHNAYMALRTLEVPTLALWSPSDYADTETEREAFAAVAPRVEEAWIEGSGAVPHEERPGEVEAVVRRFWGGLEN